jgi:hypothetical protein
MRSAPENPERDALLRVWRLQSLWSRTADRLKADVTRKQTLSVCLIVCGALAAAVALDFGLSSAPGKVFSFVAAAATGLGGLVQQRIGADAVQSWTRARSVAEELKSEVYRVLSGTAPAGLADRAAALEATAADLLPHTAGIIPADRELPAVHDVDSYLRVRVIGQLDRYYRPRAERLARTTRSLRRLTAALTAAGLVIGAAAGTWEADGLAVWVPVITTVAAAITGYGAATRSDHHLVEYLRTATELERLLARRAAGLVPDDAVVGLAEQVISAQNEGWMARLARTP